MPAPSLDAHAHTANLIGQKIDNDRLVFRSILGVGAYGVVYLAHDIGSETYKPTYYAVKCLSRVGLDARQKAFQKRELALHSIAGKHPHVVTLHKIIETAKIIYVILEYCAEGDLFGMITERQLYIGNDDLVKHVFLQIVDAVEYCHSLVYQPSPDHRLNIDVLSQSIGIYHRDLKPENILCLKGGSFICLADFGLATSEGESKDHGCGSYFYMSPECLGQTYPVSKYYSTAKNDMVSGNHTRKSMLWKESLERGQSSRLTREASPSDDTFRAFMRDPNFLQKILPISDNCHSILKQVFTLNPSARISLRDLKIAVSRIGSFTLSEEQLIQEELNRSKQVMPAVRPHRKVPPPPNVNIQVNTKNICRDASPQQKRHNTSETGLYKRSSSRFESSSDGWQECLNEYFGGSDSESSASSVGPETPDFLPTTETLEIATDDIDSLDLGKVHVSTTAATPQKQAVFPGGDGFGKFDVVA